jgi:hypothetical protein
MGNGQTRARAATPAGTRSPSWLSERTGGEITTADAVLDVFAFAAMVVFASALRWQARDVIWGLWTSSLCVGYAYIVTSIVAGVLRVEGAGRILAALGGLGLLAFFTFHFGMFHFVHSMFLNGFFPLVEGDGGFPSILAILAKALESYWPLVAATVVSRLSDFRPSDGLFGRDAFAKPYGNVVRMHVLIFVFAGLQAADLSRLAIYPVLALYFFPWGGFVRAIRRGQARRRETA